MEFGEAIYSEKQLSTIAGAIADVTFNAGYITTVMSSHIFEIFTLLLLWFGEPMERKKRGSIFRKYPYF
jgi:hypothetical protein